MWWHIACKALQRRRCLRIEYGDAFQIFEVHQVGLTDGHPQMIGFEITERIAPGAQARLRLVSLSETWMYEITDIPSQAPRVGYKPSIRAINEVFCKVGPD